VIADWIEAHHNHVVDAAAATEAAPALRHQATATTSSAIIAQAIPTVVRCVMGQNMFTHIFLYHTHAIRSGVSRLSDFVVGSLDAYLRGIRKPRGAWGDHCALIAAGMPLSLTD
jgi:hypothetical protein